MSDLSRYQIGTRIAPYLKVRRTLSIFRLFFIFALSVACSDKRTDRSPSSVKATAAINFERYVSEPLIVRVKDEASNSLAALSLGYVGEKGLGEVFREKEDQIHNLVISTLSDFDISILKSEEGKIKFQKEILAALDAFIHGSRLVRVELLEVREI